MGKGVEKVLGMLAVEGVQDILVLDLVRDKLELLRVRRGFEEARFVMSKRGYSNSWPKVSRSFSSILDILTCNRKPESKRVSTASRSC